MKTGWEFGWKISTGNGRFGQNEGNEVENLDTICSLFAKERVHICSNYLETDFQIQGGGKGEKLTWRPLQTFPPNQRFSSQAGRAGPATTIGVTGDMPCH